MNFGKNRVQYKQFEWKFYRYERFDTYFYNEGKELSMQAAEIAKVEISRLENFFDYKIDKRIIFIIYNKLSEFRQSNIGLVTGDSQYNIGGITKVSDNKVFIYFDGNHNNFKKQIKAAVANVILNELIYGSDFKARLANSTLIALPEWFISGLVSYVSGGLNVEIDDKIREGILSGDFEKFNQLTGENALYAGHSIWNYIAKKYGESVIPNIVYLTRISKSVDSGFMYVIGTSLKYMTYEWLSFYDNIYYKKDQKRELQKSEELIKTKKNKKYTQAKLSPDGNYIAFCENEMGKYKIKLAKIGEKPQKIYRRGNKIQQITDYTVPLISWHPTGQILSFITEEKGSIWLNMYKLEDQTIEIREIFHFQKIISFSYNDAGKKFVMAAVKKGQTDIFVYSLLANSAEQITNDLADDLQPKFYNNSSEILFSSNRNSNLLDDNNLNLNKISSFDIYSFDYINKSQKLKRITNTTNANETHPFFYKNKYVFLSDSSGVVNRFIAEYDSMVNYVDTAIHYRYFTRMSPLTNYKTSILEQSANTQNSVETIFRDKKFRIYKNENSNASVFTNLTLSSLKLSELKKQKAKALEKIEYKEQKNKIDTIKIINTAVIDTNNIDINNYVFNIEKNKTAGNLPLSNTTTNYKNTNIEKLKQRYYFTAFYTNYVVSQADFGFLNTSYQTYTGSAVYYNPGFNMLFKLGANDLFEDYKIVGGLRFSGNLQSNEYLLSFENIKSQLDKQYIFHRQSYTTVSSNNVTKSQSHQGLYVLKYPFSQVSAVKATTSLRYDKDVMLSTDIVSLNATDKYKYWSGLKLEYIFDNTRNVALNIYNGSRFKIFGEAYQQLSGDFSDLFVVGADFRHYQKIYRTLILASRVAGSSSFGNSKLVYYLGGTDNWINLSSKVPTFDQSIAVDHSQNYAYQTLATNMRGFSQNIRNGNNFAVINNELRLPVVKFFSNRPINSDFVENFQLLVFSDIGTAWSGKSPMEENNAYNFETIEDGNITIIIDKQVPPIVYGYGFGVRTRLLGYFVRADWAWGVEGDVILPRIFYLSLSLDF